MVMGVTIGTATGWEEVDVAFLSFYDFEPNENFWRVIHKGHYAKKYESIGINFQSGEFECYTGDHIDLQGTMSLKLAPL